MRVKWIVMLLAPVILVSASTVRAGETAAETPTVVVRFQSLDALLKNINLVVKFAGQEEVANQIEGLVKSKIGPQGLEGIDTTRPFGAYVRFGKNLDDITGAVLVPMVEPKTFLALLESLNINVTKDKDDIYTFKTGKIADLYFRFANKYLYITGVNTDSIQAKNLPDPAKALAISGNATVSMVARIDQIPNDAKLIALAQLEEKMIAVRDKAAPGESDVQRELRHALLREAHKFSSSMIREASEIRFDLDISDKTKELNVGLKVTGKPGSDFAKGIATVGSLQSPLAGLATKDAAFHGALHIALPESVNKSLAAVIDEAVAKSIAGIQDAKKKQQAETLLKALLPTAKSGEFQLVAAVLGPKDKHYTIVTALKLKEGDKLGATVKELVTQSLNDIPPEFRDKIRLDFDSAGAVKVHRFEIPSDPKHDKFINDVVGDNFLHLAFRDDALFLSIGKDSLPTLKTVLTKTTSSASMPLVFNFDFGRAANMIAKTAELKELADKLFSGGQNGQVRLTIEGGSSLNARLQMHLSVLEYLAKLKNDNAQ